MRVVGHFRCAPSTQVPRPLLELDSVLLDLVQRHPAVPRMLTLLEAVLGNQQEVRQGRRAGVGNLGDEEVAVP